MNTYLQSQLKTLIGFQTKAIEFNHLLDRTVGTTIELSALMIGLNLVGEQTIFCFNADSRVGFVEDEQGQIHYDFSARIENPRDATRFDESIAFEFSIESVDCYQPIFFDHKPRPTVDCPAIIFRSKGQSFSVVFNTSAPQISFFPYDFISKDEIYKPLGYDLVFSI